MWCGKHSIIHRRIIRGVSRNHVRTENSVDVDYVTRNHYGSTSRRKINVNVVCFTMAFIKVYNV